MQVSMLISNMVWKISTKSIFSNYYYMGKPPGPGYVVDRLLCEVFLCFCHFSMWCPGSGVVLGCIDP